MLIPEGIRRSQDAFFRDLPELLKDESLLGQCVAYLERHVLCKNPPYLVDDFWMILTEVAGGDDLLGCHACDVEAAGT